MSDFPMWSEYCDSCPGPSPSSCSDCEHSYYCPRRCVETDIMAYIKAMQKEIEAQIFGG